MTHDSLGKLVFELGKLPGIGEKTATRLAYYILKQDEQFAENLSSAITAAKKNNLTCKVCLTFTDTVLCPICSQSGRDKDLICVVERPVDIFSVEKTGAFKGLYHVLHGSLSPLEGIGPDEIRIRELLTRIDSASRETSTPIREIIFATNPSVEGEATALYISKLLRPFAIKTSRLAHGIPVGGMIEYTDRETIQKAIINRVAIT